MYERYQRIGASVGNEINQLPINDPERKFLTRLQRVVRTRARAYVLSQRADKQLTEIAGSTPIEILKPLANARRIGTLIRERVFIDVPRDTLLLDVLPNTNVGDWFNSSTDDERWAPVLFGFNQHDRQLTAFAFNQVIAICRGWQTGYTTRAFKPTFKLKTLEDAGKVEDQDWRSVPGVGALKAAVLFEAFRPVEPKKK